jgi:CheY-like chemotaxis protein
MNELILVVDDEPKITKIARDYLERNGFRVAVAGDGVTALAAARTDHPDLVVLDLNLPGMDGLDVCRALRRESDVPIIMLTARVEEMDRLIGSGAWGRRLHHQAVLAARTGRTGACGAATRQRAACSLAGKICCSSAIFRSMKRARVTVGGAIHSTHPDRIQPAEPAGQPSRPSLLARTVAGPAARREP